MQIGGAQFVERKYDWKQPNRLLVVQTGDSDEQAKGHHGRKSLPTGVFYFDLQFRPKVTRTSQKTPAFQKRIPS